MNPRRNGMPLAVVASGEDAGAAITLARGATDSSVGKATQTPRPRRNARRFNAVDFLMARFGWWTWYLTSTKRRSSRQETRDCENVSAADVASPAVAWAEWPGAANPWPAHRPRVASGTPDSPGCPTAALKIFLPLPPPPRPLDRRSPHRTA